MHRVEDPVRWMGPVFVVGWVACGTGPVDEPLDRSDIPAVDGLLGDELPEEEPMNQDWEPSALELELFELINDYRVENQLPSLPLSPSLSFVARTHSDDLVVHFAGLPGDCNLHSWSSDGAWTSCCYTPDHAQAPCMWDKPRELTEYPGNGYEISSFGSSTAAGHLAGWQSSPGHDNVIRNRDIWTEPWATMGVGIAGTFANVWFGRAEDPAGVFTP